MTKDLWQGTWRWWPVFVGLLASGSHSIGCGMFEIRDPVSPSGGPACRRVSPIDSDKVLENFAQAIGCKLDGMGQYEEALAESFHLVLDIIDVQEMAGAVDSLNRSQDVDAQRLVAGDIPDSLFFAFGDIEPERTDTTAFYLDIPYELQLIRQEGDSLIVKGKAELTLIETGPGTWVMTRWVDEREDPFTSFGRWHAERAIVQSGRPGP
jgi:hypothetical protein